jgi:hypothetical protein
MERDAALSIDNIPHVPQTFKPITAAVLRRYEDGLFLLDEPVSVDTKFANPKVIAYPRHERVRGDSRRLEAARREITIFDLLTMTRRRANSRTPSAHWPTLRSA